MCLKPKLEICTQSEDETLALGKMLGARAFGGLLLAFCGGLGMGKTKFIQGIGSALGIKRIKSPTFIIVDEHESCPPLIHADLYRLDKQREIDALDLERYLEEGCLVAVEWAENWRNIPRENTIKISFEQTGETSRKIAFEAFGARAEQILGEIEKEAGKLAC